MKRRNFVMASAGMAGAVIPGLGRAAEPCPPPQVSVSGGTSVSTSCTFISPSPPPVGAPAWVKALPLLTWKEMPNTSLSRLGAGAGICAYSGAAFKASNSQLIVFGGGHFDGNDNSVNSIILSADTPVSTQLVARSPGTINNAPYQADGKPSARHSWGDLAVDESVNRMITMQCCNPYGDSGQWSRKRDGLNLGTNTWLPAGTYGDSPVSSYTPATSCTKDAAGNIYWWNETAGALYKITPGSTTMASTPASITGGTYNACIACDTTRNRLVTFCNGDSPARYDLNNNYARTGITFSGSTGAAGTGSYWAYCPERDSFLGIRYTGGTPTIYECNANTFAVSTLAVAGTPPSMASDGVNNLYGRFGYAPNLRGFYLLAQASTNVFFFRVG